MNKRFNLFGFNLTRRCFARFVILSLLIGIAIPCWAQPQYFTGDGRKDMSLAILVPESQGLSKELAYLPAMVQGCLVSNISKYSKIAVLDRVALDKVIAETLDPTYKDNLDIVRLGHVAQTGYIMTGKLIKTSSGYTMQINVTDTTPNAKTTASYSGACTVAQLDDQTAIQKASMDLLTQMGVRLTDLAKTELSTAGSVRVVNAQTALAQGITAQKQGTEVAALSYYFQAAAFDPSLLEAVNRSSVLAANISSGSIGDDARNDIQWRKNWTDRLAETEKWFNSFFDNFFKTLPPLPYTLFYTSDIKQIGNINYQNETMNLSGIQTNLHALQGWALSIEPTLQSIQKSVQAVQDGLNATGRKEVWGLGNWPQQGAFNRSPFGRQNKNFTIVVELVNSRKKVIGRETFQTDGSYEIPVPLPGNKIQIQISADDRKTVNFSNVKANDVTDNLTVRIASVNGTPAETAARNGVLRIQVLSEGQWNFYNDCEIINGIITKYSGKGGTIVIDNGIIGEPVKSIGNNVFIQKQLTSVSIPNSVTSIGNSAFQNNQLTSVSIPNSVTSIGNNAFQINQLTSVSIPNSVTSIGNYAFSNNQLTSVSIPNSVTSIGYGAFLNNQLTSVSIPNSVTSIGDRSFYQNKLTSVSIPNSVTSIGNNAFQNNQLTSVSIPNSVTSIGNYAFSNNQLTSVTIPNSVTFIGDRAFENNQLTSVSIPNSVTSIYAGAFSGNQITSVTIPKSVTSIGNSVFLNNQLTSIIIGMNVKIGKDAFPARFEQFYEKNGKKAGTYTYDGKKWSYKA